MRREFNRLPKSTNASKRLLLSPNCTSGSRWPRGMTTPPRLWGGEFEGVLEVRSASQSYIAWPISTTDDRLWTTTSPEQPLIPPADADSRIQMVDAKLEA